MTALQKIVLGTPPAAVDGDPVRTASTKANANVDVLNQQATLTSFPNTLTAAQALTAANHLGKRVNINLAAAGTINLPAASTCVADGVIHLRNLGATLVTLAITAGSGDTVALTTLAAGESALMDTDGVHAWNCTMRGRSANANENVAGGLTVTGTLAGLGNLNVGFTTTTAALTVTGGATFNTGSYSVRPTFAAKTPWDTGNLAVPVSSTNNNMTLTWSGATGISLKIDSTVIGNILDSATNQTIPALKTFTGAGATGQYTASHINLNGNGGSTANIGFAANNNLAGGVLRLNSSSGNLEWTNFNTSGYAGITCSALTQTSDIALKTGVVDYTSVLSKLRSKRIVNFKLKADIGEHVHVGVIAQEWKEDFPELVQESGVDIDEDGDFIAHQYAPVVPVTKKIPVSTEFEVIDEEGNPTGEYETVESTVDVHTGECTGGEEIFGPNGKPESRKALTFNYANASAVALKAAIELDAALQVALATIQGLQARVSALESK